MSLKKRVPLLGRRIRHLAVLAGLLLPPVLPAWAAGVGYERVEVPDAAGPAIETSLWFPTDAAATPHEFDAFVQDVAVDAPVAGCCHPLIVVSHGNGGSMSGHYDTALALARAGFVVAAVTHPGDNDRDHSSELQLQNRPRHLSAAIDFVLSHWRGREAVDARRIGVFGFSAGGFTALVAIGATPDFTRIRPYCDEHEDTFVCRLIKSHGGPSAMPLPAAAWRADPRIRAAVIAAPALGFTFSTEGLSHVTIPIQLWAAADDGILPVGDNAAIVQRKLPQPPDYHLVPNAGHFDFLAPCSALLARHAPVICTEHNGFDRSAFHDSFDAAVVAFFARTLAP